MTDKLERLLLPDSNGQWRRGSFLLRASAVPLVLVAMGERAVASTDDRYKI